MSLTWLCLENTSKIVLFLITFTVLLAHATYTKKPPIDALTNSETSTHANSLTDELNNKEFIDTDSQQPHSRRKRLVWITDDGRLALPPGTALTFTPTISLPLVRHPPEGFFSNVSISFPVTIDFDKLGLTDNQNPLGDLPPIFSRSFGHTAGEMLGNYMTKYLHFKRKRDLREQQKLYTQPKNTNFNIKEDVNEDQQEFPQLPERFKHTFHGGERIILYGVIEDFLSTFGMNGKACLLRTICEMHSRKIDHFGVFGEMAKLFLTVTRSPFSDLIPEYVTAQEIGEGRTPPGECFPYHRECPKSLFKILQSNKYRETPKDEYQEQDVGKITRHMLPENHLSAAEILNQQTSNTATETSQDNEIDFKFRKSKINKLYSM